MQMIHTLCRRGDGSIAALVDGLEEVRYLRRNIAESRLTQAHNRLVEQRPARTEGLPSEPQHCALPRCADEAFAD